MTLTITSLDFTIGYDIIYTLVIYNNDPLTIWKHPLDKMRATGFKKQGINKKACIKLVQDKPWWASKHKTLTPISFLVHSIRHWPSTSPALGQCFVFVGRILTRWLFNKFLVYSPGASVTGSWFNIPRKPGLCTWGIWLGRFQNHFLLGGDTDVADLFSASVQ